MSIGAHVIVRAPWPDPTEHSCRILDTPENRNPVPCPCGKEGCISYQTLELLDRPGIIRHVGLCRIRQNTA